MDSYSAHIDCSNSRGSADRSVLIQNVFAQISQDGRLTRTRITGKKERFSGSC